MGFSIVLFLGPRIYLRIGLQWTEVCSRSRGSSLAQRLITILAPAPAVAPPSAAASNCPDFIYDTSLWAGRGRGRDVNTDCSSKEAESMPCLASYRYRMNNILIFSFLVKV